MAAPIQYAPTVGVEGSLTGGNRAVHAPLDNTGLAVAAFGNSLDNLGAALQRSQDHAQRVADDNAVQEAHVTLAKASADAYQQFADAQDAQGDNPEGFTPRFMKQFYEFGARIVAETPNVKAQQFLRASFANLGLHMTEKAISWHAQQNVEYKGQQVQDAVQAYARLLGNDDSAFAPIREGIYAQIEASGLPLKIRDSLREHADAALTKAAYTGFTIRNPLTAQRAANEALGVLPVPAVTVGPITRVDSAPGAPSGFEANVARMIQVEGGYVADDAGAGPTKYGINQKANPDINVKDLTPEKAAAVYKERYWDAIDADKLQPAAAKVAFDAAVNQGVPYAKKLIEQTGGDPLAMIALRRARYAETAKLPGKGASLGGWNARMDALANEVAAPQTPVQMASAASDTMVDVAPSMPVDPAATLNVPKGAPPWADKMTTADWVAMKTHADAEVHRIQGQAQAQLRVAMTDAGKAAELGMTPTIPTLDEFTAAYGKSVGQQHFNAAVQIQQTGHTIGSLQTMEPEQLMATRAQAYAKLTAPGMQPGDLQVAAHNAGLIDNAINTVSKAREADPIWAAGAQGIAAVKPIDWGNSADALAELKSRQGVAIKMRESFGNGDYSAMTKGEAAALRQAWDAATPSTQMGMLAQLRGSLTDERVYRATVQAIRPDSPVTGAAGALVVKTTQMQQGAGIFSDGVTITPQAATETMLRGEAMLNATKQTKAEDGKPGRPATLPKEIDLRQQWKDAVGNAFRGNERGEAGAYQIYRAYYAGKTAELGDVSGEINAAVAKQAAEVATGGLYDWNGGKSGNENRAADSGKVPMPWGMDKARFLEEVTTAYNQAAATAGYKIPPLDSLGLIPAQTANRDAYYLTAAGRTLFDARGKPIELDITPRPRVSKADQIPQ